MLFFEGLLVGCLVSFLVAAPCHVGSVVYSEDVIDAEYAVIDEKEQ